MNGAGWGVVGAVVTLLGFVLGWPKLKAEARKINVEADGLILVRLYAEIERLDRERKDQNTRISAQDDKIDQLERSAADEKAELERENKQLKTKVTQLESRMKAMESVLAKAFKAAPDSAEFNNLLKQVDEAERRISRSGGR